MKAKDTKKYWVYFKHRGKTISLIVARGNKPQYSLLGSVEAESSGEAMRMLEYRVLTSDFNIKKKKK